MFIASFFNIDGDVLTKKTISKIVATPKDWASVLASSAAAATALWVATKPNERIDLYPKVKIIYSEYVDNVYTINRPTLVKIRFKIDIVNTGNADDILLSWKMKFKNLQKETVEEVFIQQDTYQIVGASNHAKLDLFNENVDNMLSLKPIRSHPGELYSKEFYYDSKDYIQLPDWVKVFFMTGYDQEANKYSRQRCDYIPAEEITKQLTDLIVGMNISTVKSGISEIKLDDIQIIWSRIGFSNIEIEGGRNSLSHR